MLGQAVRVEELPRVIVLCSRQENDSHNYSHCPGVLLGTGDLL